ncbi:4'-phosphopantetheinyl transferase family protein [Streptomyces cinerochromogenes]|uniref:4'-phosphopantetheinyl transferase family protein n=1 Tax=Streptomyces cinerochromogenes TaxID=66422 RepID=UPI00339EB570
MHRPLVQELLPPYAVGAETRADTPDEVLHPEERAAVAGVSEGRRREFATVRGCARRALTTLGHAPVPLVPDPRGVPRWPAGVVGSMTHCRGYRAAVVGWRRDVRSLGVDAEPSRPLREGVLRTVSRPEERERIALLQAEHPQVACWDRLLFCVKEAVFKAWFPRTRRELGFRDVTVTFGGVGGTFRAAVLTPEGLGHGPDHGPDEGRDFDGRWVARDGLLVAVAFAGATDR